MTAVPKLFRVTLEVSDLDPWGNDLCFCQNGTLFT